MGNTKLPTYLLAGLFAFATVAVGQEQTSSPPAEQQQTQSDQPQAAVSAPVDENLKKGMELNASRRYSEAESTLRSAVAAQPTDPQAHFQLAVALFEQGKVEEAGKELEQSQPLSQGTKEQQADYYQYLGAVHTRQQKWDQALQDLQKAIELDPMEPYNHYHIGIAYGKSNRPDKMVEHLEMFLKLAPDAPEAPKAKAVLSAVQ